MSEEIIIVRWSGLLLILTGHSLSRFKSIDGSSSFCDTFDVVVGMGYGVYYWVWVDTL